VTAAVAENGGALRHSIFNDEERVRTKMIRTVMHKT